MGHLILNRFQPSSGGYQHVLYGNNTSHKHPILSSIICPWNSLPQTHRIDSIFWYALVVPTIISSQIASPESEMELGTCRFLKHMAQGFERLCCLDLMGYNLRVYRTYVQIIIRPNRRVWIHDPQAERHIDMISGIACISWSPFRHHGEKHVRFTRFARHPSLAKELNGP